MKLVHIRLKKNMKTNKTVKFICSASLLLLLGGCAMTPQYERPGLPVTGSFDTAATGSPASDTAEAIQNISDIGWREVFADPGLQTVIETALANNRDLRETALNIEAYQAQYRIQRAALLPSVSADGYGQKQRTLSGTSHATTETYTASIGVTSYELDLFGRVRSLKDQALENYLSMEETHRSTTIALVAEVSGAYLTWLADKELLQITEETKKTEESSYALIEQRVNAGIANELELAQARTSLESVKASLAMYRRQVALDFHALTLLAGADLPESVTSGTKVLSDIADIKVTPKNLSSETLLQRPDIMAAEHDLIGANANIGAARAAFFPMISLNASVGLISTELGDLFDGSSGSWLFRPAITIPVFNAGKLKAELDVAKITKEIYVVRYEAAIQTAFREVSDTLVAVETYNEQLNAQKDNLDANEQYYGFAKSRYEEGVDSFLTLLDAQRSLYSSRQDFLSLQLAQLKNQVDLYKVLGGGWKESNEQ